jgi:hypothetical protein
MYFEGLIAAMAVLAGLGIMMSAFFLSKGDSNCIIGFILSALLLAITLWFGFATDYYSITGEVCDKNHIGSSAYIKVNEDWYAVPTYKDYLDVRVGDIVTFNVIDRHYTIDGDYKLIEKLNVPHHNVTWCGDSKAIVTTI